MSAPVQFALLFALCVGLALLLARPLGIYIARVMEGERNFALRWGGRLEAWLYRICGIDATLEMTWLRYAGALLLFNLVGALLLYALQRLQIWLPLNPQHFAALSPDSAFNTAISFVTNTDWQGYSGESAMSYFTQALGLSLQNFLSAASGLTVAVVIVRGFKRFNTATVGNFWVDLTRASLYVLLPLSVILAVLLMGQGVIQNLDGYREATTLEAHSQILTMGPVASQEAIKELGTNGGGFFNANSAHPFENPTALSNLLEITSILLIPFALTATFGRMVGDARQGWALMIAMLVLFGTLAGSAFVAEQQGNPLIGARGVDQTASALQGGGNMEGKEARFGIGSSALFAAATTGTSTGAVNTLHDSMMPMGGFVPLFLMQLGELAPGGVGTGLYSMVIFAILSVFIAGLMIGRTPEYLGKKIEAREMKLASLFILITPIVVLLGTALAVVTASGLAGIANPGPHGFTEILYAYSSAGNNNGSAFGGLTVNTPFYNLSLGIAMWLGRFWPIVAALAIGGSLAAKKRVPVTEGTMPTHGPLFIVLLIGTVLLIGVLNYVPALALGPLAEHFLLAAAH
jgi:K+-transporting ATPase ATPase A chain